MFEERHLKAGRISEQFMCGVHCRFVYQLDRTAFRSKPMVALPSDHILFTRLCSCILETLCNDSLKRIFCHRDVEQKRGRCGDFVAQMTLDLELHRSIYSKLQSSSRNLHSPFSQESENPRIQESKNPRIHLSQAGWPTFCSRRIASLLLAFVLTTSDLTTTSGCFHFRACS